MRRPAVVTATLALAVAVPLTTLGQEGTLDDCDAAVARAPDAWPSYRCYLAVAGATGDWVDAARRLDALLAVEPDRHLARAVLGRIESNRGRDRAETLLRDSARGLAEDGNPAGAVHSHITLAFFLVNRGRVEEAEAELAAAEPLAEQAGEPALLARLWTRQAGTANHREDFGRALRLLDRAEQAVFADGAPVELQCVWLSAKAFSCWALGRLPQALELYRREAELWHAQGNLFSEAVPRRNIVFLAGGLPDITVERRRELALEALEIARAGGNRGMEGMLRWDLSTITEGDEALEHAGEALRLARERKQPGAIRQALQAVARHLVTQDPERAFRTIEEATDSARRWGSRSDLARASVTRARMRWETGPREQAIEDYLAAFELIEATRNLQLDDQVRAERFGSWGKPYGEFVSRLLGDPRSDADVELAFATLERRRARVLLERLDAAGATERLAPGGEIADRRAEVLAEISRVQSELVRGGLSDTAVDGALAELERLEREEAELRAELVRADPVFAALRAPTVPTTAQTRAALADDQALLYYQIEPWEADVDSWLLVLTRGVVRHYRLPPSEGLARAVGLFNGLFERRDGAERVAAARLHDELLRDALAELPGGTRRLVIVPHLMLNLLPFGALHATDAGEPLAARYEIALVPSAATWLRWRGGEAPAGVRPVLVLADPELSGRESETEAERASVLATAAALGPLRHARREGRSVARLLGRGSTLHIGAGATEPRVKAADLGDYRVLHFAAHALVDGENPERSAIALAPGVGDEDGLLQIREVVELELSGQTVVLSACRSAYGTYTGSEGVMDLARAFFRAGAGTVVGSLWPLRDAETAALFEGFYRRLARGRSVVQAMADAKRERIAGGAPAAAWAGVVVLGNGDAVPLPGGAKMDHTLDWALSALVIAALALTALVKKGSRNRFREPSKAGGA